MRWWRRRKRAAAQSAAPGAGEPGSTADAAAEPVAGQGDRGAEPSAESSFPTAAGEQSPDEGAAGTGPANSTPSEEASARDAVERGEPSATTLASVAERVNAILEAAEAAAAAIRREAEADAVRATEARKRQRLAREELKHLSRLAGSLSVQAEAISRQCDVVASVLDAGEEGGARAEPERGAASGTASPSPFASSTPPSEPSAPAAPAEPAPGARRGGLASEAAGEAAPGSASAPRPVSPDPHFPAAGRPSPARSDVAEPRAFPAPSDAAPSEAPRGDAAPREASPSEAPWSDAAPREAPPSEAARSEPAPSDAGRSDAAPRTSAAVPPLPSEFLEAYRMRLAGADRREVEIHLRRVGADDPSRIAAEVFRGDPRGS